MLERLVFAIKEKFGLNKPVFAYKLLYGGGTSPFMGFKWPLPITDLPAAWVHSYGDIALCSNGIHGCTAEQVEYWYRHIHDNWHIVCIYEIELAGRIKFGNDKIVAERGRLLREVPKDKWRELFAI